MGPDKRSGAPPGTPPASPNDPAAAKRPESAFRIRREAALRLGPFGGAPWDPPGGLAGAAAADRGCWRAVLGADGRWRRCCPAARRERAA